MTTDPGDSRADRPTSRLKWLRWALGVLALLLVGAYLASPYLVARLSPMFAARFGLSELALSIGHPGLSGIEIKTLVAKSDEYLVRGENARLDYSWAELRKRRFDRLVIKALDVSLYSRSPEDPAAIAANNQQIIPDNPFRELSIEQLVVRFADTGFVGTGNARLNDAGLSLFMNGVEPQVASRFAITAELSRDGVFNARFGERDSTDAEFLILHGALQGESMSVQGSVNLSAYPLQLASEFAGLPLGTGEVAAEITTNLPWPLPETLAWHEISASVASLSVDWISLDKTVYLDAITGAVTVAGGELVATLSGGFGLRNMERQFTARLPQNYDLKYAGGVLTGGAGLQMSMNSTDSTNGKSVVTPDTVEATALLRSFSYQPGQPQKMAVDADVDAVIMMASETGSKTTARQGMDRLQAKGRVTARLDSNVLNLDTDLQIISSPPPGRKKSNSPRHGKGTLNGMAQLQVPAQLPEKISWRDLDATVSKASVKWVSTDSAFKVREINGSASLSQGLVKAAVAGSASYRLNGNDIAVILPKNYPLNYTGDRFSGGSGLRLSIKKDETDTAATLRSFALKFAPRIRLDIDAGIAGQIQAVPTAGRLTGHVVQDDAVRKIASGQWQYSGWLQLQEQRHEGRFETSINIAGERLSSRGVLSSALFDKAPVTLDYHLGSGAGELRTNTVLHFNKAVAAQWIPGWSEVYDLDGGRVDTAIHMSWQTLDIIGADIAVDINNGRGHYKEILAKGINGRLQLRADNITARDSWRLEPAMLNVASVDVGFPVSDVALGVAWRGERIDMQTARATVLGGTISASPFVYEIPPGNATTVLTLDDIDLAAVLALEGDDIIGTGTLSGTLPVSIANQQVRVEGGRLVARAPGGLIKLKRSVPTPKDQPGLGFALQALRDFSYTTLEASIDYAENGDLGLGVTLLGRNPAVEKGRAIRYNLNITENIPVLLQSLRLKDKVTESIEKKVKK